MTVGEMVNNGAFLFEVNYNVVKWEQHPFRKIYLFSNLATDKVPEAIERMEIQHVVMYENYLEIEV